jgi:hypothetical protein
MFNSATAATNGNKGKHRYSAVLAQAARVNELKKSMVLDPLLPAGEARLLLGISYGQMRLLVKRGQLPVWRTSPKGHMKFRLSVLTKFRESGFQNEGHQNG